MKASYIKIIGLFFLLALLSLFSANARAAKKDELRSQIEEKNSQIEKIEKEIAVYQRQIEQKEQEAKTLKNQISSLNITIQKLNADISLTQKKINAAELSIKKIGLEIKNKEQSIKKEQESLAELLREFYDLESASLVEMLLQNGRLSDFFDGIEQLESLEKGIQTSLTDLRNTKEILEEEKQEKQSQQQKFIYLQEEYADRKAIEGQTRRQKAALLQNTKNQEAQYQKILKQKEKERQEILKDIQTIEDELRRLINPNSLPESRPGVLSYPVKTPIINQGFGLTEFAQRNSDVYVGGGHNGIDFRAPIGTPVYAAKEGVVLKTGNTDLSCPGGSYGKWILIEHPNNLATLYAHLSLIKVASGQNIKNGQLIAYSGNSGYTTGPHLHFTVYAAGSAGEIRFGPSKSGRCKLLPYGGYLNPLDYL